MLRIVEKDMRIVNKGIDTVNGSKEMLTGKGYVIEDFTLNKTPEHKRRRLLGKYLEFPDINSFVKPNIKSVFGFSVALSERKDKSIKPSILLTLSRNICFEV